MFLTPRFFVLSAVVALLSAVGFFWSPLYTLALVLLVLLAAALVLDAVFALLSLQCEGRREVDPRLSLGAENPVRLVVRNSSRLTARILPLDELPEDMASSPLPDRHMALRPGQTKELTYRLRPDRRGHFAFGNFYVFARTVIGFWERRLLICGSTEVKVYPEFRHLSEREAQYRLKNDVQVGKRLVRTVDNSTEFEEIREFIRGDDFRRINWKATARRQQVMVNHFDDERSQLVYTLVDYGRHMQRRFDDMTLVDHAINAALQLSFTAMHNDDLAGLVTFGHDAPVVVPPRKSAKQLGLILEQLYHLQPRYAESDFSQLASVLAARAPRHALMVLFTDFLTENAFRRQLPHLRRIAKKHALVVVFFEDAELTAATAALPPESNTSERVVHALTAELVLQKQQMVDLLRRNGIHALCTRPEQLTGNVVRKYFALKKRGVW